ncbi:MAG: AAA family ATPase [Proteobacteria bacterium]|nr:AAA family ATPase [Pseudomonadota bacterium]
MAHDMNMGDRKQVTVLFADIVRSSDIVKKYDSEVAQSIFDLVIARQIEITKKFEGTINQVMGDGIMCLFGAEPPFEEHALRAVSAAREMVRSAIEVQRLYKKIKVRIRIGVNTGEVVLARPQHDGYRATFRVTGEAVHMTDRVLKQAKPNHVIVSQSSKIFLEKYYRFRRVGSFKWHPAADTENLYEPSTLRGRRRCTPALPARRKTLPRTSFAVRILALLTAAQERQEPKIIWLHGAPGIGKSHFLNHFLKKYRRGVFDSVIRISFYPDPVSDKGISLERAILQNLCGGDDACTTHNILLHLSFAERNRLIFPDDCLRDILGIGNTSAAYSQIDITTRAGMKADLVARLLLAIARNKPVLFILEDVHWAREDSLAYLRRLIDLYQGSEQLFLMATSRRGHPFGNGDIGVKIKGVLLDPMTAQEGLQWLQLCDPQQHFSGALRNKIYGLSGGNPYFLNEYLAWAQESIRRGLSEREIKRSFNERTPSLISDILYNRFAMVGGEAVRIVKIAAVLGMRVNLDILQPLCRHERKMLISLMEQLEDADILRLDRLLPVPEWVFTHELLQRVIYQSIPKSARVVWHRAVITTLKRSNLKGIENRYLILAAHAERSGDKLLQYIYSKWAARCEKMSSRHKSCLELSCASRRALMSMPHVIARERHDIRARLFEIDSLFITGRYALAQKQLGELLSKKHVLKKLGYFERALSFQELYLWVKGDLCGAAKIAKKILLLAIKNGRREVYIRENSRLGNIYLDLGRYKAATEHDLNVVRAIPDHDFDKKFHLLVQAKPASLSSLTLAYAELGDAKKSQQYFDHAYGFFEKSNDGFTRIFILVYLAHSLITQNKNREALVLLKTAHGSCRKVGAFLLWPYVLSAYGIALVRTGKPDAGLSFCEEALAVAAKHRLIVRLPQFEAWHKEARIAQRKSVVARKFRSKQRVYVRP